MGHDSQTEFLSPTRIILILGVVGVVVGVAGASLAQDVLVVRLFDSLHWTAGTLAAALLAWFGVRSAQPGSVRGLRWIALDCAGRGCLRHRPAHLGRAGADRL